MIMKRSKKKGLNAFHFATEDRAGSSDDDDDGGTKGKINLDRCLINGVRAHHSLESISSDANYVFVTHDFSVRKVLPIHVQCDYT